MPLSIISATNMHQTPFQYSKINIKYDSQILYLDYNELVDIESVDVQTEIASNATCLLQMLSLAATNVFI